MCSRFTVVMVLALSAYGGNIAAAFSQKSVGLTDDNKSTQIVNPKPNNVFRNENLILNEMASQKNRKTADGVLNNETLLDRKRVRLIEQYEKMGEDDLYARVIESFRSKDKTALSASAEMIRRKFPSSLHIDNSIYFMALLDMQENSFVPALRKFESVIQDFPAGNKRVSALFAKAVLYKKLNLVDQSQTVLNQVMREYPGSPESQRSVIELKLLSSANH